MKDQSLPFLPTHASPGQKWLYFSAILGGLWVASHLVTIFVTTINDGTDWGATAWLLDLAGLIAGLCFAILCWSCSNLKDNVATKAHIWVCVWASITLCARLLDTLMLFGFVELNAIYAEPHGLTFWSNFVSEVLIGNLFAFSALIGSVKILRRKT